jgi:hypothetical protein
VAHSADPRASVPPRLHRRETSPHDRTPHISAQPVARKAIRRAPHLASAHAPLAKLERLFSRKTRPLLSRFAASLPVEIVHPHIGIQDRSNSFPSCADQSRHLPALRAPRESRVERNPLRRIYRVPPSSAAWSAGPRVSQELGHPLPPVPLLYFFRSRDR